MLFRSGLQMQLQQAAQQIQALEADKKYGLTVEQMRQEGQTRRTLMQETARMHDSEGWREEERQQVISVERTRLHDVMARTIGAQNVAEINATAQLLLKHLDIDQIRRLNDEAEAADRQTMSIDKGLI